MMSILDKGAEKAKKAKSCAGERAHKAGSHLHEAGNRLQHA